jgi:hypothetical protein
MPSAIVKRFQFDREGFEPVLPLKQVKQASVAGAFMSHHDERSSSEMQSTKAFECEEWLSESLLKRDSTLILMVKHPAETGLLVVPQLD